MVRRVADNSLFLAVSAAFLSSNPIFLNKSLSDMIRCLFRREAWPCSSRDPNNNTRTRDQKIYEKRRRNRLELAQNWEDKGLIFYVFILCKENSIVGRKKYI